MHSKGMIIDMNRSDKARELFLRGYGCTQAVTGAFSDIVGIDFDTLMRISSSFGGGFARLREVCGTVSGAAIVLGAVTGYSDPNDFNGKTEHYRRVQEFAKRFKEKNGSYICRELLGLAAGIKESHVPEKRTAEYYKKRPCSELCASAAEILEEYLKELDIGSADV